MPLWMEVNLEHLKISFFFFSYLKRYNFSSHLATPKTLTQRDWLRMLKEMNSPLPKSILLIDDDHDNRVALRMALEANGYSVQTAANGKIALAFLERNIDGKLPDLVLLDLVMPLMDGEEFLGHIEKNPSLQDLNILIITSHKDRLKLLDKKKWILKPFDLDSFVSKIETFINCENSPA